MHLGELDVPEPSLFFQAEPEEIDLFIDSNPNLESEHANQSAPKSNAMSVEESPSFSLLGAWSGSHSQSGGLISFSITGHNGDGTFEGSGVNANQDWAFTIVGILNGVGIDFTKFSVVGDPVSRYVGILDAETGTVVGKWGPPEMDEEDEETDEEAMTVSIIESGARFNPEDNMGQDSDEDPTAAKQGGYFTLVRRPVDYFLYRPSDAEFRESRPKALWKMVRNAAGQWYRSRHLIWDVLRERRDLRNRYVELFLEQEEVGRLSNPFEITEWARINRQTHPNDLRLWRAIARYKQRRSISHLYVQSTPNLLQLTIKLTHCTPRSLVCDNCGDALNGSRLLCCNCTTGGLSQSFDLCTNCCFSTCSRKEDDKYHTNTHTLLQLRGPPLRMEHTGDFVRARQVVNFAQRLQFSGVHFSCKAWCNVCGNVISEKPYWRCMECIGVCVWGL